MITAFDNSMLSNLKRCPAYFYYRHILHIVPSDNTFDTDFKAQFGVAVHYAMDEWFAPDGTAEKMDTAFTKHWLPFEGCDPRELRTLNSGLSLLKKYRDTYPKDKEPFTVKHIEVGFAVPLGPYIYCGRIDKVVEWKFGLDGYVVLDHKTSTSKGYLTLKPNSALDGYMWGSSQVLSEPVVGACLDQMYIYKSKFDIFRESTTRIASEIDTWKEDTILWMQLANTYQSLNQWPKNTNSCKNFAKDCEYMPLCKSTCSMTKAALINDVYAHDEWSPYPNEEEKGDE